MVMGRINSRNKGLLEKGLRRKNEQSVKNGRICFIFGIRGSLPFFSDFIIRFLGRSPSILLRVF
jgi:hypothetical protein